jgi:hypothetical protein
VDLMYVSMSSRQMFSSDETQEKYLLVVFINYEATIMFYPYKERILSACVLNMPRPFRYFTLLLLCYSMSVTLLTMCLHCQFVLSMRTVAQIQAKLFCLNLCTFIFLINTFRSNF